jgi:hypothetical protein
MRTHDGYGIRIRRNGTTYDIQYRHYSAKNYDLSQDDAIRLATEWAQHQPRSNVVIVTDEGSRHGNYDHIDVITIPGTA